MAKNTTTKATKKSTAGVPRITKGVMAMDVAGREKWFNDKCANLAADVKAEIRARLDQVNAGKYTLTQGQGQGRKIDFAAAFAKQTASDLLALKPVLEAAIEAKREAALAEIAAAELELASRKAALATA